MITELLEPTSNLPQIKTARPWPEEREIALELNCPASWGENAMRIAAILGVSLWKLLFMTCGEELADLRRENGDRDYRAMRWVELSERFDWGDEAAKAALGRIRAYDPEAGARMRLTGDSEAPFDRIRVRPSTATIV